MQCLSEIGSFLFQVEMFGDFKETKKARRGVNDKAADCDTGIAELCL